MFVAKTNAFIPDVVTFETFELGVSDARPLGVYNVIPPILHVPDVPDAVEAATNLNVFDVPGRGSYLADEVL